MPLPPPAPSAHGRRQLVAVIVAGLLVVGYHAWTATHGLFRPDTSGAAIDLLQLQVEAFHNGQLHLPVSPDPRLLALENPYDPELNRGTRLLDATLYQGKYYTYFGPTTSLLMLPWYALTGRHMPGDVLAWLLAAGLCATQLSGLLLLIRKWLPLTPAWLTGLLALMVGTATLLPALLRLHGTFELPVLAGLLFTSIAVLAGLRVWAGSARENTWWTIASLAVGCAIGSRPNLAPALLTALGAACFLRARHSADRRRWLAAGFLLGICLLALGTYNFLRFGSPVEFGNTYTLVELDWRKTPAFSLRYLPSNLFYYLASVPRLSWFFPFYIEPADLPWFPPAGYLATYADRSAGFAVLYPGLLLAPLWLAWSPRRLLAMPSGRIAAALVLLAALIAAPILLFVGASVRYQAEIAAPLALAGAIASLAVYDAGSRSSKLGLTIIMVLTGLLTALANLAVGCVYAEPFVSANPRAFTALTTAANRISEPLARLAGWSPQIVELELRFPRDQFGKLEPLYVHGRPPEADFVYLLYASPEYLQIGVESMGRGGPVSDLIPIDYGKSHRLELILGAFLPPAGHPFYARAHLGPGDSVRRILRIKLDGKIVLDAAADFHRGRERHFFGESPDEPTFGRRFTGSLSASWHPFTTAAIADWLETPLKSPVGLEITWPKASTGPRRELLLSIGAKNRGEFVYVHFHEDGRAQLSLVDSAGQEATSPPFSYGPGQSARLTIDTPGLRSISTHTAEAGSGRIVLNGSAVLEVPMPPLQTGPQSVALPKPLSFFGPAFSGQVEFTRDR